MVPILKKLIVILMRKIGISPDQYVFLTPELWGRHRKSRMKVNQRKTRVKRDERFRGGKGQNVMSSQFYLLLFQIYKRGGSLILESKTFRGHLVHAPVYHLLIN